MKSFLNRLSFFFSFLAIVAEKIIQSFWQAFIVLIYYASFIFVAIKRDWVSTTAHQILFFVALIAFLYFLHKNSKTFSWPTKKRVISIIEERNRIRRGSLSSVKEKNIVGDTTLWKLFQYKTQQAIPFLRPLFIRTDLSQKDPFALRFFSLLILLVAFWFSTPLTPQLFAQSVVPKINIPAWLLPVKPRLTAWVIPPQYTGIAPLALNKDTVQPIIIPEGSKINVNIAPFFDESSLTFSENENVPFSSISDDVMTYEGLISNETNQITIIIDNDIEYSWKAFIQEDYAPSISFLTEPRVTDNQAIEIFYIAQDDYGIKNTKLIIDIAESYPDKPDPLSFDIPNGILKKQEGRNIFEGQTYQDLTSHPWSGKTVALTLTTEDDFGHIVESEQKIIQLPERVFKNPVSQKLVQIRNSLLNNYVASKEKAMDELEYILVRPGFYNNSPTTFLLLKSALNRIHLDKKNVSMNSVADLLWDIALSLEEGRIFEKQKEVRKAQNDLMKALNDPNATTEELNNLLDQYKKAIENMIEETMRELVQQINEGKAPVLPFSPDMMDKNGLDQMIEELKHLAETGQKEKLMEALQKMQNMMENSKSKQLSQEQMKALESIQELNEIISEQTEIFEKTEEVVQQQTLFPQEKTKQDRTIHALSEQQMDLRGKLDVVLDEMKALMPDYEAINLMEAGEEMKNASDFLKEKNTDDALISQQEALEKLQQGMKDTMQSIQQNLNLSFTNSPFAIPIGAQGMQPMPLDGQYDPFGRKSTANENIFLDETENQDSIKKSKEIIHELRKRSGERYREKEELDYIDRLLDRF